MQKGAPAVVTVLSNTVQSGDTVLTLLGSGFPLALVGNVCLKEIQDGKTENHWLIVNALSQ